jgi:hypothetical protein
MQWKGRSWVRQKQLAAVISRVFDPVVLIPLIVFIVTGYAYINGFPPLFLILIIFTDVVLPGIVLIWFQKKRHFKDWDIYKREERLPLFTAVILCHGLGVLLAIAFQLPEIVEVLFVLWLLSVAYAVISLWWKISVHAGVCATLATLVTYYFGSRFLWMWLVVIAVAWARVVDRDHTFAQVFFGCALPPVVIGLAWRVMGVS